MGFWRGLLEPSALAESQKFQCRLDLLTEALQGKSRWLRKAPLELSHPDRLVFEGQGTVLLFAAGSAAKEQWFVALSAALTPDGGAGASVHALYNTFCDYVRKHALVEYPQVWLVLADKQGLQHTRGLVGLFNLVCIDICCPCTECCAELCSSSRAAKAVRQGCAPVGPCSRPCMLDAEHATQAVEEELQAGGAGGGAVGKARRGQGRWLSRWLARDGSSRKQGREKGSAKKPEGTAVQPKPEGKPAEHWRHHARSSGPGEPALRTHGWSCLLHRGLVEDEQLVLPAVCVGP